MKRKLLATALIASAGIAHSQVFFSDEDFYRHIEKKQQMAVAAAEMLERAQQRQEAKELALKRRVNAQKALDYYWLHVRGDERDFETERQLQQAVWDNE